jgi:hypothetical protein
MLIFGAKQLGLAASWLSAALKVAGYSGAAEVIDFVGKSATATDELKSAEHTPVAKVMSRVRYAIETGTRQALTAEFGADWEHRDDLAAAIVALPDVLARSMPSSDQIAAANFDPIRITETVVDRASAIDRDLFGPSSLGQSMLREIVFQSYTQAQQSKEFVENFLIHGLRTVLDRIDDSHKAQERIEQILLEAPRSNNPEVTKTIAKAVTAELVPLLTRELLPYVSNRDSGSRFVMKEGVDPIGQVREMHAQWVQAALSQESVKSFFAMGSAIAHELRVRQRNVATRVFCLDTPVVIYYLDPRDSLAALDRLTIPYFMHKGRSAGRMAMCDASFDEVEHALAFLTSRPLSRWTYRSLAALARVDRFLADNPASGLVEVLSPSNLTTRDSARAYEIFSALSHRSRRTSGANRVDADQLEQIERANHVVGDCSYVSLLTLDIDAERIRTALTPLSNGSHLAECVESVWGSAWGCFVGRDIKVGALHAFEHLVSHVILAGRYLRSLGRRDGEAQHLSRFELEMLRAAIVGFGHSIDPFFQDLVSHFDDQRHLAAEEACLWVADLLSGGRMLEELISKSISLLPEGRPLED